MAVLFIKVDYANFLKRREVEKPYMQVTNFSFNVSSEKFSANTPRHVRFRKHGQLSVPVPQIFAFREPCHFPCSVRTHRLELNGKEMRNIDHQQARSLIVNLI